MTAMLAVETRYGDEVPRIWTPPKRPLNPQTTKGYEVIAFCEDILKIELLPWQKWLFIHALELTIEGTFRFRYVLVLVARQNGKTLMLNVLTLWRMFMDHAMLIIGTAQNLDVAEEAWSAAVDIAQGTPELNAEIAHVDRPSGKKALRLNSGARYKVQAANRRGGRGLSADMVALDELREHQKWDAWAAVTKTTTARKAPQVWGFSNAGDRTSVVLSHLRSQALTQIEEGNATNLGLFEWSAPDGCGIFDLDGWAAANPSLGYLITEEALRSGAETDPEDVFRTESLCQFVESLDAGRITPTIWSSLTDPDSQIGGQVVIVPGVRRDRSSAVIVAAGLRADGLGHVEIIDSRPGTAWLVGRVAEVARQHSALVAIAGPAISIEKDLVALEMEPQVISAGDRIKSAAYLYDAIIAGRLRHRGQPELLTAIVDAQRHMTGNGWEWEARDGSKDVTAIQAASVALWVAADADYDPIANIW